MNLYIPASLADQVKAAARKDRRSVSQFVQILIERAINNPPNNQSQCN